MDELGRVHYASKKPTISSEDRVVPKSIIHGLIRSMSKCRGVGQNSLALVKSLSNGQASLQCGGC